MSEKNIIIRLEAKDDYRAAENLTREAFWNVYRPSCVEHYVLHCYRNDPAFVPELDFLMELDGELIGQIIYVQSEIDCDDGRKVSIMTFGPISIAPAYKRQGYGKQLLDYSMEKASEMGAGALCSGQNQGCMLCRRPGCGLFSHQRIEIRISGRHLRHLQRPQGVFCL